MPAGLSRPLAACHTAATDPNASTGRASRAAPYAPRAGRPDLPGERTRRCPGRRHWMTTAKSAEGANGAKAHNGGSSPREMAGEVAGNVRGAAETVAAKRPDA